MIYHVYRDASGVDLADNALEKNRQWRWRLSYTNGKIHSVSSEAYKRKAECLRSIDTAKRETKAAAVVVEK